MNINRIFLILFVFIQTVSAQTTEFNYQGKLTDNGTPAPNYDFEFRLFTVETGGVALATMQRLGVPVANGVFTARLDFGAGAFDGSNRWLELAVKRPGEMNFVTLAPRQTISSAPYAMRAVEAANALQFGGLPLMKFVQYDGGNNVGIGTAIPTSKLDVRGNLTLEPGTSPTLYTSTTATEQNRFLQLINSFNSPSASGLKAGRILISDSYGFANPGKNDLIVKGSVGIGTAAPQSPLAVQTAGHGITQTNGTVTVGSYIDASGGWLGTRSNNPLHFFTNNSSQLMTLGTNGRLGIGTVNPAFKLQVNGDVGLNFCPACGLSSTTPVCRADASGGLTACGSSSLRCKTEVNSYLGGLNLVRALRPITFRWKSDGNFDFGLAAEEAAAIEPLLAIRNAFGEIEGVRYERLNIVLINAVKEQQNLIERQEQKIDRLMQLVCSQNRDAEICRER